MGSVEKARQGGLGQTKGEALSKHKQSKCEQRNTAGATGFCRQRALTELPLFALHVPLPSSAFPFVTSY